jgi:hypothetical protein
MYGLLQRRDFSSNFGLRDRREDDGSPSTSLVELFYPHTRQSGVAGDPLMLETRLDHQPRMLTQVEPRFGAELPIVRCFGHSILFLMIKYIQERKELAFIPLHLYPY